jgi:hypothetical protein
MRARDRDATIYFTRTHIADLRTVIQADSSDQFETNTRGGQNTPCRL